MKSLFHLTESDGKYINDITILQYLLADLETNLIRNGCPQLRAHRKPDVCSCSDFIIYLLTLAFSYLKYKHFYRINIIYCTFLQSSGFYLMITKY
jgi:hypothetical protein